jgi:UDP-2,3-diacylglucosamine pyrophosphatase LpxH
VSDETIYFVSDTHLGDGTSADRFRYLRQFMALLDRIAVDPGAHLVLLGDFMELWATSLEPVMVRHAPLLSAIARLAATHPVTYVVGNHDCLPWYYFIDQGLGNVRIAERFTGARGALIALHGHQYDPFNQVKVTDGHVKAPWTRRLVQAIGFLERIGGEPAAEAVTDAGNLLTQALPSLDTLLPDADTTSRQHMGGFLQRLHDILQRESPGERGYPLGESAYENAARSMLRGSTRFVVMGHTHHPLMRIYGSRTYVNTGSWVWDRYPPTYARFAGGQLELLHGETHQPYRPPD